MANTESTNTAPIDALAERLNDPAVAASLITLLDNAELLSTLVIGLSGFVERGDMIMDAVAEGVNDLKASAAAGDGPGLPPLSDLKDVANSLAATGPALGAVAESAMVRPETIDLLSLLSEAATEGAATARASGTRLDGVRDIYRTLKDPDVQRGIGMLVEISRSLGRRLT